MEQKFKTGDTVWIKNEKTSMNFRCYKENGVVICNWFIDGKIQEKYFLENQLTLENPFIEKQKTELTKEQFKELLESFDKKVDLP